MAFISSGAGRLALFLLFQSQTEPIHSQFNWLAACLASEELHEGLVLDADVLVDRVLVDGHWAYPWLSCIQICSFCLVERRLIVVNRRKLCRRESFWISHMIMRPHHSTTFLQYLTLRNGWRPWELLRHDLFRNVHIILSACPLVEFNGRRTGQVVSVGCLLRCRLLVMVLLFRIFAVNYLNWSGILIAVANRRDSVFNALCLHATRSVCIIKELSSRGLFALRSLQRFATSNLIHLMRGAAQMESGCHRDQAFPVFVESLRSFLLGLSPFGDWCVKIDYCLLCVDLFAVLLLATKSAHRTSISIYGNSCVVSNLDFARVLHLLLLLLAVSQRNTALFPMWFQTLIAAFLLQLVFELGHEIWLEVNETLRAYFTFEWRAQKERRVKPVAIWRLDNLGGLVSTDVWWTDLLGRCLCWYHLFWILLLGHRSFLPLEQALAARRRA